MTAKRGDSPQLDLFVSFLQDVHLRDQQDLMERPFFSLSKNKRLKEIEYRSPRGDIFVHVRPHQSYGMATIWDADVLIWAASQLNRMKKQGVNNPPRILKAAPYELLRAIGRDTGGHNAQLLIEAINRLKSTIIETNIRPPDGEDKAIFSWIDAGGSRKRRPKDEGESAGGSLAYISITVSDWFYRSVLDEKALLSIDPAYFAITGGRERWLYRVARKHAGGNGAHGYGIEFPTLFEKSGAEGTYRRFKFELLKLIERDALPGYALTLEAGQGAEPILRMTRRDAEPAAVADKPVQPQPPLTEDTIEAVRRARPRQDVYGMKAEFDAWLDKSGGGKPGDYQAAFIAWTTQPPDKPSSKRRD